MQPPIVITSYVAPTDLPTYYALVDVVVQPSLRDGLPNALRSKLGAATRQTIMDRFTPRAELEENLSVYQRLGLKL